MKGSDRPYHTLEERIYNLRRLKDVTKVVSFSTDKELIWHIQNENADYMVIGSDYKNKAIIGVDYFKKVFYFDRIINRSTTNIVTHDIAKRRS